LALIPNDTNPWVELTSENQLTRGGCLGANKHMFKPILNQCGTLGIVTGTELNLINGFEKEKTKF
jgi:hypothetical protein